MRRILAGPGITGSGPARIDIIIQCSRFSTTRAGWLFRRESSFSFEYKHFASPNNYVGGISWPAPPLHCRSHIMGLWSAPDHTCFQFYSKTPWLPVCKTFFVCFLAKRARYLFFTNVAIGNTAENPYNSQFPTKIPTKKFKIMIIKHPRECHFTYLLPQFPINWRGLECDVGEKRLSISFRQQTPSQTTLYQAKNVLPSQAHSISSRIPTTFLFVPPPPSPIVFFDPRLRILNYRCLGL